MKLHPVTRAIRLRRVAALAPVATAALALAACAARAPEPVPVPAQAWVAQARDVATSVPPKLLATLQSEIERGGPEGAIDACRVEAPRLAAEASRSSGWQVRRVSLRERNPKAVPDAWEREVLESFDRDAAAGVEPACLERSVQVQQDGRTTQRYMRALPTQPMCVQCHGPVASLQPAVRERLAALYPKDRATGYAPGQIRGAITLSRMQP